MDILLTLLLLPFVVPMALGFVTMCCCTAGGVCTGCCSAQNATVTIIVSGITNGSCLTCNDYNITWIVPWGSNKCVGGGVQDKSCASGGFNDTWSIGLSNCGGPSVSLIVQLDINGSSAVATWQQTGLGAPPIDCSTGSLTPPLTSSGNGSCTMGSAACNFSW
jgi:hypothetical protein